MFSSYHEHCPECGATCGRYSLHICPREPVYTDPVGIYGKDFWFKDGTPEPPKPTSTLISIREAWNSGEWCPGYAIKFPYNAEFLAWFKESIPCREWWYDTKEWWVHRDYAVLFGEMFTNYKEEKVR